MKSHYYIISKTDAPELVKRLKKNGDLLEPIIELIENSSLYIEEMLDNINRAILETVLLISVADVAGQSHQGKRGEDLIHQGVQPDIIRHGAQRGLVFLGERRLMVQKPRLRDRTVAGGREILLPAFEAMKRDKSIGARILETMMKGVSTRNYDEILTESCEYAGVSMSSMPRDFAESREAKCKMLLEPRFDDIDIFVIYIDGQVFEDRNFVGAVGMDRKCEKHVLGVMEGEIENAVVVKALLESLVERGISPGLWRFFVTDGSKALRAAIDEVYGEGIR